MPPSGCRPCPGGPWNGFLQAPRPGPATRPIPTASGGAVGHLAGDRKRPDPWNAFAADGTGAWPAARLGEASGAVASHGMDLG